MKKIKHPTSNTAITLVALVVTVIVLLILAGVTLNMVIGQNGIFAKSNTAKEETKKSQALEDVRMKVLEAQLDAQTEKQRQADLGDVVLKLEQSTDTYKITKISKIAKLAPESTTTAIEAKDLDVIYVTNTKYEYEVKVDRMLQASITGEAEKEEEPSKTYTITFNTNGGNIEKTSKQIEYNEEYGELETPTKIGYNFDGWYTQEEGGTKIISNMKYTLEENQTLYAHWLEKTYVSEGLILHYDGINNTENGHSGTATTWKDLSGNGNDGIINGATWEDNCLSFDGIDDWVNCGEKNYSDITIEVVTSYEKTRSNTSSIVANTEGGGYVIALLNSGNFVASGYLEGADYINALSKNIATPNKIYSLKGRLGSGKIILNENDEKYNYDYQGNLKQTAEGVVLLLGDDPTGSATASHNESFCGRIYSVRIYNRILTDEEIENNYEIDRYKFGIN